MRDQNNEYISALKLEDFKISVKMNLILKWMKKSQRMVLSIIKNQSVCFSA